MGKRKRVKLSKKTFNSDAKSEISTNKESKIVTCNLLNDQSNKKNPCVEFESLIANCGQEYFANNFVTWMTTILQEIKIDGNVDAQAFYKLLSRASRKNADLCKHVMTEKANIIFMFISKTDNRKFIASKLVMFAGCMKFASSIFGPYKNKIEIFLNSLLETDCTDLEQILGLCFSYLPLLGGGGSNAANRVASWSAEMDRHLDQLDRCMGESGQRFGQSEESAVLPRFRTHCRAISCLVKLDVNAATKVPFQRILETVAKTINFGSHDNQQADAILKMGFSVSILSLLADLVKILGERLWPFSEVIFKSLAKFIRFSNDEQMNLQNCQLKCQIYKTIESCLLANHSCKLRPLLIDICEAAILDCAPRILNEPPSSVPMMDAAANHKKKKRRAAGTSDPIGSSLPNQSAEFEKDGYNWLDFESVELTCASALKVMRAVSAMNPLLIEAEKNEHKRNRVELMIPIWAFTVQTLQQLKAFGHEMHPYNAVGCRRLLYELLRQHVYDDLFYESRFYGYAYTALCSGCKDTELKTRLICQEAISIYDTKLNQKNMIIPNQTFETDPNINAGIKSSIFSSCRSAIFADRNLEAGQSAKTHDSSMIIPEDKCSLERAEKSVTFAENKASGNLMVALDTKKIQSNTGLRRNESSSFDAGMNRGSIRSENQSDPIIQSKTGLRRNESSSFDTGMNRGSICSENESATSNPINGGSANSPAANTMNLDKAAQEGVSKMLRSDDYTVGNDPIGGVADNRMNVGVYSRKEVEQEPSRLTTSLTKLSAAGNISNDSRLTLKVSDAMDVDEMNSSLNKNTESSNNSSLKAKANKATDSNSLESFKNSSLKANANKATDSNSLESSKNSSLKANAIKATDSICLESSKNSTCLSGEMERMLATFVDADPD